MKALIVDDHSLVRHGLEMLLIMQLNFKDVFHAEDAKQALETLEQQGMVDLVLLDYRLGDDNGLNVLARLKARWPGLPVAIMSGFEEVEPIVRSLGQGAVGFIPKRLTPRQLTSAIEKILAGEIYVPELQPSEHSHRLREAVEVAQANQLKQVAELTRQVIRDKDLSRRFNSEMGEVSSALNALLAELEQDRNRLEALAFSDELTGVANRRLFIERAEAALKNARRRNTLMALVYVDLNQFKTLNDTHGHPAGDTVLTEVARRLSKAVREVDTVARLGGDEFTVVLVDIATSDGVRDAAERIHRDLLKPIALPGGASWDTGMSMGVAVSAGDEALRELMSRVDDLMYRVKHSGANQYIID